MDQTMSTNIMTTEGGANMNENTNAALAAVAPDDIDRTVLTPEETARVQKIASTIDVGNDAGIDDYASDVLGEVRKTASVDLGNTRIRDVEGLSKIITGIDGKMTEFKAWARARKMYDDLKKEFKVMQKRFQPILNYVNEQEATLDRHVLRLAQEEDLCDRRRKAVESCRRELMLRIKAGRIALQQAREGQLVALTQKFEQTKSREDEQAVARFKRQCDTFEIKLFHLEEIRTDLFMRGPAIEQEKESNRTMKSTLISHRDYGIPLLIDVMNSLVGGSFVRQSIGLAEKSRQTLSDMMMLAADVTGQNAVDVEKAKGKGVFNYEALEYAIDRYCDYTQQVQVVADENLKVARETLPKLRALEDRVAEAGKPKV
jgi:uncharacterized protein YaaN involved in tellurite resistance